MKNGSYRKDFENLINMNVKEKIVQSLEAKGVVILPPMDVFDSIKLLSDNGIHVECTMLDPWYNKGTGGVLPDAEYDAFIMVFDLT